MADITLLTIQNDVTIIAQGLSDLRSIVSGIDSTVTTNSSEITNLQNPPPGLPPGILQWFSDGHTITENDTILASIITEHSGDISDIQTGISDLTDNLDTEISNRVSSDTDLQTNIDSIQGQVTIVSDGLTQEIFDRATLAASVSTLYTTLNTRIDTVISDQSSDTLSSNSSINSLFNQVASITSALQTANTQIQLLQGIGVDPAGAQASQITTLTTIANDASASVNQEITDRQSADNDLQDAINEASMSISSVQSGLSDEVSARTTADNDISVQVGIINTALSGNTSSIAAETSARTSADSAINTTLSSHTTLIADNSSAIANEITNRTTADTALQSSINTNASAIAANTTDIVNNIIGISRLNSHFGVVKDNAGYITSYRILDDSLAGASFNLKNLNNNARLQNTGYEGKFFPPVSVCSFAPPISYDTQYGVAASSLFHGTDGNDYTRSVLVYATGTVGMNGSVFKGVDFGTGGDLNRLGQVVTVFLVNFSGAVNRYLSLWYRIKNDPADTTQRWYPVDLADNTIPGARTYERISKQQVVRLSVATDKVIEFGLTTLNTLDASIADATNGFIYGGSVSIQALNMITIS